MIQTSQCTFKFLSVNVQISSCKDVFLGAPLPSLSNQFDRPSSLTIHLQHDFRKEDNSQTDGFSAGV